MEFYWGREDSKTLRGTILWVKSSIPVRILCLLQGTYCLQICLQAYNLPSSKGTGRITLVIRLSVIKKTRSKWVQRKGNAYILTVRMEISYSHMESGKEIPWKIKNRTPIRSSGPASLYIPKRSEVSPPEMSALLYLSLYYLYTYSWQLFTIYFKVALQAHLECPQHIDILTVLGW